MGNCCGRRSSSAVWAGDEWEPSESEKKDDNKEKLPSHLKPSSGGSTTEVKIKITKKELEELLGKAEVLNLSSEQVLARLINSSSGRYSIHQHHHWRPGLTSIPEVN